MSALETLKEQARNWAKKVVALYNTPVPPELEAEKGALLKYAKVVKNSVEGVLGKLDEFGEIEEISGLGFVPFIPVLVVGAAAAAITKWTLDYATFNKKIAAYNDLTRGGLTNAQAINVIDKSAKGVSILPSLALGSAVPLIGGALLLFYFLGK